jgi:hypothetical protein
MEAAQTTAGGGEEAAVVDAADAEENWRAQLDELTALASIYEGDARVLSWPWSASGDEEEEEEENENDDDENPSSALLRELERAAGRPPPTTTQPHDLVVELLVHVDVPPERGVQPVLPGGVPLGAPLKHLPPIRLVARLPLSYPSFSPPSRLGVRAAWLDRATARRLESALLPTDKGEAAPSVEEAPAVWQQGEPVLFGWAEWLRERALPECCAAEEAGDGSSDGPLLLVLRSGGGGGRRREDLDGSDDEDDDDDDVNDDDDDHENDDDDPQALAMRLQRYSSAREAEAFARRQAVCGICFETSPGTAHLRRLTPECEARHPLTSYCRQCLRAHAEGLVAEGSVGALCCPEPGCRAAIPADVLRDDLLSRASFERWERLLLSRSLSRMTDVVWCPRCPAASAGGGGGDGDGDGDGEDGDNDAGPSPCIEDPQDRLAQCARCGFSFCGVCAQAWHPGRPCLDEEARLLVLERRAQRAGAAAGDSGGGARDARREADAAAQLLSLRAIREATRPCPGCGAASVRSEGCNKMTCPSCGSLWCWRCGADITHAGYNHFKQQPAQAQQQGGGAAGAAGEAAAAGGEQQQQQQQQPAAEGVADNATATTTTPTGCRLFEQEEIDRWQRRMEAHEREQAMAAAREGLMPPGAAAGGGVAAFGAEFDQQLQAALEADAEARMMLRRQQQQPAGQGGAAGTADLAAARTAARVARRQAIAALRRAAAVCPVCGQVNARHRGSNLVRCWSCLQHFCAACRLWIRVRPVAAHFRGKGACPQHAAPLAGAKGSAAAATAGVK